MQKRTGHQPSKRTFIPLALLSHTKLLPDLHANVGTLHTCTDSSTRQTISVAGTSAKLTYTANPNTRRPQKQGPVPYAAGAARQAAWPGPFCWFCSVLDATFILWRSCLNRLSERKQLKRQLLQVSAYALFRMAQLSRLRVYFQKLLATNP